MRYTDLDILGVYVAQLARSAPGKADPLKTATSNVVVRRTLPPGSIHSVRGPDISAEQMQSHRVHVKPATGIIHHMFKPHPHDRRGSKLGEPFAEPSKIGIEWPMKQRQVTAQTARRHIRHVRDRQREGLSRQDRAGRDQKVQSGEAPPDDEADIVGMDAVH